MSSEQVISKILNIYALLRDLCDLLEYLDNRLVELIVSPVSWNQGDRTHRRDERPVTEIPTSLILGFLEYTVVVSGKQDI